MFHVEHLRRRSIRGPTLRRSTWNDSVTHAVHGDPRLARVLLATISDERTQRGDDRALRAQGSSRDPCCSVCITQLEAEPAGGAPAESHVPRGTPSIASRPGGAPTRRTRRSAAALRTRRPGSTWNHIGCYSTGIDPLPDSQPVPRGPTSTVTSPPQTSPLVPRGTPGSTLHLTSGMFHVEQCDERPRTSRWPGPTAVPWSGDPWSNVQARSTWNIQTGPPPDARPVPRGTSGTSEHVRRSGPHRWLLHGHRCRLIRRPGSRHVEPGTRLPAFDLRYPTDVHVAVADSQWHQWETTTRQNRPAFVPRGTSGALRPARREQLPGHSIRVEPRHRLTWVAPNGRSASTCCVARRGLQGDEASSPAVGNGSVVDRHRRLTPTQADADIGRATGRSSDGTHAERLCGAAARRRDRGDAVTHGRRQRELGPRP